MRKLERFLKSEQPVRQMVWVGFVLLIVSRFIPGAWGGFLLVLGFGFLGWNLALSRWSSHTGRPQ